jgi:hypothetical protein
MKKKKRYTWIDADGFHAVWSKSKKKVKKKFKVKKSDLKEE